MEIGPTRNGDTVRQEVEGGQTVVVVAAGMGLAALVLLLLISLGGVFLSLSNAQDVLRDAARAAALAADGRGGELHLDRAVAEQAARVVFDLGLEQVSGWLVEPDEAPLEVEVLNLPPGSCASFPGGGRCYRRPAVRLRTRVTVRVVAGVWGAVSFDVETVAVAGVGDPAALPTPAPTTTPAPIPTEVVTPED